MSLLTVILLLLGFFCLIKGSDVFVDALTSIAASFKMPKILIALTVAAFGTCAPELAISFQSISAGNGDVALANVLGSCIVNILLIVGLAASIFPIRVKDNTVKKELPLLALITGIFCLLISDNFFEGSQINTMTRVDGIVLIFLFCIFIYYLISTFKKRNIFDQHEKPKYALWKATLLSIVCLIVIIVGSDLVVDNAVIIAESLGVSQKVITMTIIVIGTSLPELTMTVLSARKGEFDIAVGNIIGTNIFNIGIVLGVPIAIYGNLSIVSFNIVDAIVVFIAAFSYFIFSRNDKEIKRGEGLFMLLIFIVYYTYMFMVS